MKEYGVIDITVISRIGIDVTSRNHYLRTKGRMESEVEKMGFNSVCFVRPSPKHGKREVKRLD